MYFFLSVVLNCWLNANPSLNLPRSTCDERKPSVHEDRDSAVANENPYNPVHGHCTIELSTIFSSLVFGVIRLSPVKQECPSHSAH